MENLTCPVFILCEKWNRRFGVSTFKSAFECINLRAVRNPPSCYPFQYSEDTVVPLH